MGAGTLRISRNLNPAGENRLRITYGPSRWELFAQLHQVSSNPHRETITFYIKVRDTDSTGVVDKVIINSISREDGSGDRFLIAGFFTDTGKQFAGFYDCVTHKGFLNIQSDS